MLQVALAERLRRGELIGFGDNSAHWRFLVQFAKAVHSCLAAKRTVGWLPTVEKLPLAESILQFGVLEIGRGVKLDPIGLPRSLYFAVEGRRERSGWAELDAVLAERLLKRHAKELASPIRLGALNRKGNLLQQPLLQETHGVLGSPC